MSCVPIEELCHDKLEPVAALVSLGVQDIGESKSINCHPTLCRALEFKVHINDSAKESDLNSRSKGVRSAHEAASTPLSLLFTLLGFTMSLASMSPPPS